MQWRTYFSHLFVGEMFFFPEVEVESYIERQSFSVVYFCQELASFFRLSNRKSYGEHHEVSGQGMVIHGIMDGLGWRKRGGGGYFFLNQKTKVLRILTLQYSHSCSFWCIFDAFLFFSETFWDGNLQEEDTEVSQFFSSLQHGGPRPLVKHCCARRDFSS